MNTMFLLGLWPVSLLDTVRTMLLVTTLFAGPLFEQGIVDGAFVDWIRLRGVYESLSSWIGYRNYVVVCSPSNMPRLNLTLSAGSC
jgi:prenyl protein peptidase